MFEETEKRPGIAHFWKENIAWDFVGSPDKIVALTGTAVYEDELLKTSKTFL